MGTIVEIRVLVEHLLLAVALQDDDKAVKARDDAAHLEAVDEKYRHARAIAARREEK